MINQLRLYRIDPALKQVFLDRFRDHAARIMRDRYGFTILAMWLSDDEPQQHFTYLLSWPDRATMREAWRRFMADEEWSEVKRRSREGRGEAVQAVEDIVLDAVAFSAPLG
jgi:hypothetical protein